MLVRNWIVYIITVISLAVFSILYIKHSGFIVLMMATFVPLIYSVLSYFFAKRKVKVVFEQKLVSAKKKEKIELPILIESGSDINKGGAVVLYISVKNGMNREPYRIKRKIFLVSEQEEMILDFMPENSGMNEIKVEKIKIYNGFSLFRSVIRVDAVVSFLVMPEYREFPIEFGAVFDENEGESDRFSASKPGNDPSELYDIRDYRQGDKLNRINWKFSAKNSTLMVQDYGFPIACDTAVFVDISSEKNLEKTERIIEMLYYLTVKLTLAEKLFYVVWKDFHEQNVKRRVVSGQEDIYDLFVELFRSDMGKCTENIEDIYSVQYEGEFLASSIFLYTGRKEVENEIVRAKLRTDYLEFVYV